MKVKPVFVQGIATDMQGFFSHVSLLKLTWTQRTVLCSVKALASKNLEKMT